MTRKQGSDPILKRLRLPLALTRLGMLAEQVVRSFWPLFSVVMAVLAVLMLGAHEALPVEVVWTLAVVSALAALVFLVIGVRRMHWPVRAERWSLCSHLKRLLARCTVQHSVIPMELCCCCVKMWAGIMPSTS